MAKHRRLVILCLVGILIPARSLLGQSTNAAVTGQVTDPLKAVIAQAKVTAINNNTNVRYEGTTNQTGSYLIPSVPPGDYRIEVEKTGFKTIVKPDILLHVQDTIELNFEMAVGSATETVTVQGGTPLINTESATVSTVVDRQFVENLPLNGRSFQTLIQLTPGVVLTVNNFLDSGQFSVNGQRAASNYWMVDGTSANIGVSPIFAGNGLGGALGSFSVLGGTNSLVSVDAMQEFRIQTSTYAPEFGRTPGGQISIVTRSGTNQFCGTMFDYLRNDVLDANDWFANNKGLPKPRERQNDFGGTFSGPIIRDRSFFFFSYEGLRLRLPQVALTTVPCDSTCNVAGNVRAMAVSAMQPFLNAFPLPNGPEVLGSTGNPTGAAQLNGSFSNPATLDAYSLRVDHKLGNSVALFGRYNYSPSKLAQRGAVALNRLSNREITTQTATLGATWTVSPLVVNDLRFNYSRTNAHSFSELDNFGGAVPLTSLPFPSPFTSQNASFSLTIRSLVGGSVSVGKQLRNVQRQFNVVDNLSVQRGSHSLKFGVDFRRLSPLFDPNAYGQGVSFLNVANAKSGSLVGGFAQVTSNVRATFRFHNLGIFAQDTWRPRPRLTLTYGVRWDVDFAPSSLDGPDFPALIGFNLNNLSNLALAPAGTPAFNTPYRGVAPRIGIAYQVSQSQDWQTVLRGGFGVFYDLATQEVGNNISTGYPFAASTIIRGTFPLTPAGAAPPPIAPPNASNHGILLGFDPHLELPYTLEWNAALEQAFGRQQLVSVSYVGAVGRRLMQSAQVFSPNPNFATAVLMGNLATSDYHALQVQIQRRLSHGLQALASYAWSHSIDTASAGSFGNGANQPVPVLDPNLNRGPSDFDIRHALSAGVTYDLPTLKTNALIGALVGSWSIESVVQVRSAPPVNVFGQVFSGFFVSSIDNFVTNVRPDVVSGQPFYLFGPQYPGGRAFNPAAFTAPPVDPNTGAALRQGNLGRNALRGFGATQWDFAVHRDFPIHESLKLQFRAELFNVLNHPNFGQPNGNLSIPASFGRSTQMLGLSLQGGNVGGGAFNSLYQIGGPRSIQFGLKLQF